jgi:hypothetical protein
MDWDRLVRLADFNRHGVVLDQELDLLCEVGPEKVGPRYGRLVHARPCDEAVGKSRVEPRMGYRCDAHKRIGGAHARANRLTIGMRPKTIAQECGIAPIDFVEASDRRRGIGKGFRRDTLRGQDAQCRVHVLTRFLGWAPIDADSSDFLNI